MNVLFYNQLFENLFLYKNDELLDKYYKYWGRPPTYHGDYPYSIGDKVKYVVDGNTQYYICIKAHVIDSMNPNAITPLNTTYWTEISMENNHFIKFSNGLMIQWGYDAGGTASKLVNYPIPFKAGTIPSIGTSLYNLSSDGNKKIWTAPYNITNEGFNCTILYENKSGYIQTDGKRPFTWFAIGFQ